MSNHAATLLLACCATAHYVIAMVLALYARHQVKYLPLAWIMGIFAVLLTIGVFYGEVATATPGMLHPVLLLGLVAISYLQSIFPLSIPMPGYLQWGRMWRYAFPALALILLYGIGMLLGSRPELILTAGDLRREILSGDILIRLAALALSVWYIINIFRLPRRLTHVEFPRYLIGYSAALGLSAVFYVFVAIDYEPRLMMAYVVVFTLLNLYLAFRTLETMALALPKPVIKTVEQEPTEEELRKAEEDFNEANEQRFKRVQYWMQRHPERWQDMSFGRDRLCEETGLNRHLMLQCLRSQGFNNVHDYINTYRIEELKRIIRQEGVNTLTECTRVGFGTLKTLRSCFLKQESISLDEFIAQYNKK